MSNQSGLVSLKGMVWTAAVLFVAVGGVVIGLNNKHTDNAAANTPKASASQSGVPEGGHVSIPVPSSATVSAPVSAIFYDAGPHGWHAVQQGGGNFMQYDGTTGLKYKSSATKDASGNYTALVPDDMCGDII